MGVDFIKLETEDSNVKKHESMRGDDKIYLNFNMTKTDPCRLIFSLT